MNHYFVGKDRIPMKPFLHRKVSIVVALVLLLAASSTAFAAVAGDPLKLGLTNTINILTTLTGNVNTTMFRVINNSTTADASAIRAMNLGGGPALDLRVLADKTPMIVNSSAKVSNLNVDKLDGLDSTSFMGATTFTVESVVDLGTSLGDGTFVASVSCPAGSILLSGGPANVNGSSVMVESFPQLISQSTIWKARIHPQGIADNWNVVALCAKK
jgi:hypothetical protein